MRNVIVLNVKMIENKKQLRAFVDISIDSEIIIYGVRVMEDGNGYWLGFPQSSYKSNGHMKYSPHIEVSDGLKRAIHSTVIPIFEEQIQMSQK